MKIRYSEFHPDPSLRGTINDSLPRHRALAAIDSGLAVEIPYASAQERLAATMPKPSAATVQWVVAQGAIRGAYYISAKCSQPNCSTFSFDGVPSGFVVRQGTTDWNVGVKRNLALEDITFIHSCGCGQPEKVPAQIAAQYRQLWKSPTSLSRDEASYFHDARPQKSEPVDPKTWQYPLTAPLREGNESGSLANFLPNPGDGKPLDPAFHKYK